MFFPYLTKNQIYEKGLLFGVNDDWYVFVQGIE